MSWRAFFWILGALLGLASLIMALARTPPNDAMSNLAKWAEWVGIHHVPLWLRDRRADQVAVRWALATAIIAAAAGTYVWLSEHYQPSPLTADHRSTTDETRSLPAKPERPSPVYGSLQPWQSAIFINALAGMKEELSSKIMIARPQMLEPQQFSRAFENSALRAGVTPIVVQQNPTGPDQTGVMIAVPDTSAPSSTALKLRIVIQTLGFDGNFVPLLASPESSQSKEIGNFAIFIGPSPL
jgi:hypothetical protein